MNRKIALLLTLLTLLSVGLTGCGQQEPEYLIPPDDPAKEENAGPPEASDDTEQTNGDRLSADALQPIDLSYLEGRSLAIQSVWAANEDILFVFAASLSDGFLSEKIQLHTYSIKEQAFTGDWIPLGVIGQYPQYPMKDGTVAVVTCDSESYEYDALLFIDPYSLSCTQYNLRTLQDVRSVLVSPDKSRVALTTQQGLRLTDLTFQPTYAEYAGFVPENGDPDLDYHLPMATGFLSDNSVTGKLMGWEWVYCPFILSQKNGLTALGQHPERVAEPFGDGLLLYDSFTIAPLSMTDKQGGSETPLAIPHLPESWDEAYVSCFAVDSRKGLVALAAVDFRTNPHCNLTICTKDAVLVSLELPGKDGQPVSFDQIAFAQDGGTAYLLTGATVDDPRVLYALDLGQT